MPLLSLRGRRLLGLRPFRHRPYPSRFSRYRKNPRFSAETRKVLLEEEIPDAGADVDEEVRDDERPHAAPPDEDRAEEQAQQRVAEEAAPALVQVVRTTEDRADDDRGERSDAELAKPSDEVAR